eukprot:10680878-Alexandrium_andersonii.AAC.1
MVLRALRGLVRSGLEGPASLNSQRPLESHACLHERVESAWGGGPSGQGDGAAFASGVEVCAVCEEAGRDPGGYRV